MISNFAILVSVVEETSDYLLKCVCVCVCVLFSAASFGGYKTICDCGHIYLLYQNCVWKFKIFLSVLARG